MASEEETEKKRDSRWGRDRERKKGKEREREREQQRDKHSGPFLKKHYKIYIYI